MIGSHDLVRGLLADALDLGEAVRLLLDDAQRIFAELLHDTTRAHGTEPCDVARAEKTLDARHIGRGLHDHACGLELQAKARVRDPVATQLQLLADEWRLPVDGHGRAAVAPLRLQAKNTELPVIAGKDDAVHESGEVFLARLLRKQRLLHGVLSHLLTPPSSVPISHSAAGFPALSAHRPRRSAGCARDPAAAPGRSSRPPAP